MSYLAKIRQKDRKERKILRDQKTKNMKDRIRKKKKDRYTAYRVRFTPQEVPGLIKFGVPLHYICLSLFCLI